jgi:hypothetical protein
LLIDKLRYSVATSVVLEIFIAEGDIGGGKKTIPELLLEAISIPRHPEVITVKINRIIEHPKLTQADFIPHQ